MMHPAITTVLFDWDDTLIDSKPARVKALGKVFASAGIKDRSPERFFTELKGTAFQASLEKLAKSYGIKEDLFPAYRRAYWFDNTGADTLFNGIREMLDELQNADCTLGIVASTGIRYLKITRPGV